MIYLQIIFWLSFAAIAHTYVLYPIVLSVLAKSKKGNQTKYTIADDLPSVAVLLAVYNEEMVIEQKIIKTFVTDYPKEKIKLYIGSDASTDRTEQIVMKLQNEYPQIIFKKFEGRSGKIKIINELAKIASEEIFILTDANVIFKATTIFEMIKHFKNKEIDLVGGNIQNKRIKRDGISVQEKSYLFRETEIKHKEGLVWGSMIGAFGGVYSIRKEAFDEVPSNYFVDDFYITMHVLERGGKVITELDSVSYEDVSNKVSEEFRRKVRISIGNFQNLARFKKLLFPPFNGLAFAFLSHKVFRWLGPFFIILMLVSSAILAPNSVFYRLLFFGQLFFIMLSIIDFLLRKIRIHILSLRFLSHFYLMNLALLTGFFKYIFGTGNNIWQPTKRNQ